MLLYTSDKQAKKEVREIIFFTIATNNVKYFDAANQASERPVWQELQVSEKKKLKKTLEDERSPLLMDM